MGGMCSTHESCDKFTQLSPKNFKGTDNLVDLDEDGRLILNRSYIGLIGWLDSYRLVLIHRVQQRNFNHHLQKKINNIYSYSVHP